MMRWIGPVLVAAGLLVLLFLAMAFAHLSFDPAVWPYEAREGAAMAGYIICLLCMAGWLRGVD